MFSQRPSFYLCLAIVLGSMASTTQGEPLAREIFVPYEALKDIMDQAGRRVFLSRVEYNDLLERAKKTPEHSAPHETAIVSARYESNIENGHASITGVLTIELTTDGLHVIPLEIGNMGLRRAMLDGMPASVNRSDDGKTVLFVEGKGRHELLLNMTLIVEMSEASQTITYSLPSAATNQINLQMEGNVEIKSGASVIDRIVDVQNNKTQFVLLPNPGTTTLVMTLNNKRKRTNQLVNARNVIVSEVTESYEKLHISSSMNVLLGSVKQFRYSVPDGFEVIDAKTQLLYKWSVETSDSKKVLVLDLREEASSGEVVHIVMQRIGLNVGDWTMPKFRPVDSANSASVVGLLVQEQLQVQSLVSKDLISIDAENLTDTLPSTIFDSEPGAPKLRMVSAYYSPQSDFQLNGRFAKPSGRVDVVSSSVLSVSESGLKLRTGFSLLTRFERIFGCNVVVDSNWQIEKATYGEIDLPFESYVDDQNVKRIHVELPTSVAPGEKYRIDIEARYEPSDWTQAWQSKQIIFPDIRIAEAAIDRGAIAITVEDDLRAVPVVLENVLPLDDNRKAEFNLQNVSTSFAFRYDVRPFSASFEISKVMPKVTAHTYSFFAIRKGKLVVNSEIAYDVKNAIARSLSLELPLSTPKDVSICGVRGATVKNYSALERDGKRTWNVELANPMKGEVQIAISFIQPIHHDSVEKSYDQSLPVVSAAGVSYQTGAVTIESDPDLELTLLSNLRSVDIGELAGAEFQPGRHLLGAYDFVGAVPKLDVRVQIPDGYSLPSAIVQRGELTTSFSASGVSQTAARFLLRTKAQFLQIELPTESTLWSVMLDQKPMKPQRDGGKLLVSLSAGDEAKILDLQFVYESTIKSVNLRGNLDLDVPKLFVGNHSETQPMEVPLADLRWNVFVPHAYAITKSHGTVTPIPGDKEVHRYLMDSPSPWSVVRDFLFFNLFERIGQTSQKHSRFVEAVAGHSQKEENLAPMMDSSRPESSDSKDTPTSQVSPFTDLFADDVSSEPNQTNAPIPQTQQPRSGGDSKFKGMKASVPWALQGHRSLEINLTAQDHPIQFQSLGSDPHLAITIVNRQSLKMLSVGTGVFVFVIGLLLRTKSVATKSRFLVFIAIFGSLLAIVFGKELQGPSEACILAIVALIIFYLLASCWKSLVAIGSAFVRSPISQVAAVLVLAFIATQSAQADKPMVASEPVAASEIDVATLEAFLANHVKKPVNVPKDAVVIPYSPDDEDPKTSGKRVMVPYEKYVQLWNLAYPDAKIETNKIPAEFSFAGADWKLELRDDTILEIHGTIDVQVFADQNVMIPIAVEGGVLTKALIDGQPATLKLVSPQIEKPQTIDRETIATTGLTMLLAEGVGRKKLDVTIRYAIVRQGGWRSVQGQLPIVSSTNFELNVPEKGTELRLTGFADRKTLRTEQSNQQFEFALANGQGDSGFRIQWRPKVDLAAIDQNLAAESEAVLDIQEDGLRLTWSLKMKFSAAERDYFEFSIPHGFVVERIEGDNIKNWNSDQQLVQLELLKAVSNGQEVKFHLSRHLTRSDSPSEINTPFIGVPGASIHEGRLAIRKSPLLDVRVTEVQGLTRTDISDVKTIDQVQSESPLGVNSFQAFRFSRTPFEMILAIKPIAQSLSSESQILLRLSEDERTIEARVIIRSQNRALHNFEIKVPSLFEVEQVAAGKGMHWSVSKNDGDNIVRVFLPNGVIGELPVVLLGKLGDRGPVESVQLPQFTVLGADRQTTSIVVQTDPSLDARVENLSNCQSILLNETHKWLAAEQRRLARLAVKSEVASFSGNVKLVKRSPRVTVQTVSNLSATKRTFQETILFDFQIEESGIQEVSFLLPARLRDATVSAPLIRRRHVEELEGTNQIRFRLELQEEVIGQFRVLISQDSLINDEAFSVAIPSIETGRTVQRFVSLESTGRAELTHEAKGITQLSDHSGQWKTLTRLLGSEIMSAFVVDSSDASPTFTAKLKDRQVLETVSARIQFAETVLCVDASGSYRGTQTYKVENTTEQFLELDLPDDAQVWTVRVADEAVKPVHGNGSIRIPLIKTAAGDLDYSVVVTYGGSIGKIAGWEKINFPLIQTSNINVEESQVRLWLPGSHRWQSFDGTMRKVDDESDLFAGILNYNTKQLKMTAENLKSDNPFTKLRAQANLKSLQQTTDKLKSHSARNGRSLSKELGDNTAALRYAQDQLSDTRADQTTAGKPLDNRYRLNQLYVEQSNGVARDIVNSQANNFDVVQNEESKTENNIEFRSKWLEKSGLYNKKSNEGRQERVVRDAPEKQSYQVPSIGQRGEAIEQKASQRSSESLDGINGRSGEQQILERFKNQLAAPALAETAPNEPMSQLDADRKDESNVGKQQGGIQQGTHLASLNVDLPTRGTEYRFTTPRGDIQIEASAIDRKVLGRVSSGFVLGISLAVTVLVLRRVSAFRCAWLSQTTVAIGCILLGLAAGLIFPFIGGMMILAGFAMALSVLANRVTVA